MSSDSCDVFKLFGVGILWLGGALLISLIASSILYASFFLVGTLLHEAIDCKWVSITHLQSQGSCFFYGAFTTTVVVISLVTVLIACLFLYKKYHTTRENQYQLYNFEDNDSPHLHSIKILGSVTSIYWAGVFVGFLLKITGLSMCQFGFFLLNLCAAICWIIFSLICLLLICARKLYLHYKN